MTIQLTPACFSRLAYLAVVALWAGIYLPALGTLELQGEEGRRAQPGLTMLESGDWLVPEVGGEDYFRKPPLVNWAVAASVRLTGVKSEWSVRLPSVLAVLALGLGLLHWLRPWLGLAGALLAALVTLTNISLMEKGRLIEIEALYIALCGLATAGWLRYWLDGRRLAAWLVAGLLLGLAMLAKGPLHLWFFYVVVAATLRAREGAWRAAARALIDWRHALALALCGGIFALWALPMQQAAAAQGADAGAAATWSQQLLARLGFDGFSLWTWWENLFRSAIVNFLPWAALFPLVWHRPLAEAMSGERARLFRALRWALIVGWLPVAALPGSAPRYTLPLMTLAAILVAIALVEWNAARQPPWLLRAWRGTIIAVAGLCLLCGLALPFAAGFSLPLMLAAMTVAFAAAAALALARRLGHAVSQMLISAALMVCISAIFALAVAPKMRGHDQLATMAGEVAAVVPDDATLYFFRPDYQPLIFYLPRPLERINSGGRLEDLPARYLLVRERHLEQLLSRRGWSDPRFLLEVEDLDGKPLHLLKKRHAN